MKYDAILYDLDRTVINTVDRNIYPLMTIIKEELGVEKTYDELVHYKSFPGIKVLEHLKIKDIPTVYKRWLKYANDYEDGARIYYNFDEIIHKLDGKVIQAVVSSKKRDQYQIDMNDKNIDDCFSAIVLLEDADKYKPDPEPLLHCATLLSVDPKKCLYVGDSLSDFEAAKNAGMDFAYASWGGLNSEEFMSAAHFLKHPNDLLDIVLSN